MKQDRYLKQDGDDWIDTCADELTTEEFRGAMKFTIGKYLARLGKKDPVHTEVKKIADYAARWLAVEEGVSICEQEENGSDRFDDLDDVRFVPSRHLSKGKGKGYLFGRVMSLD